MKVFTPSNAFSKVLTTMIVLWNMTAVSADASDDFEVLVACADKDKDPAHRYATPYLTSSFHKQCDVSSYNTPLSCSLGDKSPASCCYEATNGLMLATQFWDYNPATGPADLFTTHGLWSDLCTGGYKQYCNPDWEITDATEVLRDAGANSLLAEMNYSWKNQGKSDADLWLHEFNKHGTCMDTVSPSCYSSDANKYQYVVDFFTTVVKLQKTLPTYKFLEAAGITPTDKKQYSKADMLAAIKDSSFGHNVYLGCTKAGALSEVYYHFYLRGAVANGMFVPTEPPTGTGNCPDKIWYYPKGYTGASQAPASSTTKATINVSGQSGCLNSAGKWATSGCDTFTIVNDGYGNLHISSSAGKCGVSSGSFSCSSSAAFGDFTKDPSGYIQYGGSNQWSSSSTPSVSNPVGVSSGSGSQSFKLKASS